MHSDEESEITNSAIEPIKIVRRFSVETESNSDLSEEIMTNDHLWSERNVWVPDFHGEAEYDNEMRIQLEYEGLLADLYDSSSSNDGSDNQYVHHQLESSDEEPESDDRSENLRMFEDSDDEYPIRSDVFLTEADNGGSEREHEHEIECGENSQMELLTNSEYEWIIENLDSHEIMIAEEVLLNEPRFWID